MTRPHKSTLRAGVLFLLIIALILSPTISSFTHIAKACPPPDQCPGDPNKTAPGQCGCGTPDTDTDGDGVADCNDQCPGLNDAIYAVDPDGDGVLSCYDGCPNDGNKTSPGVCGCGVPDTDSDGDGTKDCLDECPNDPNKILAGDCGCGNPEPVDSCGCGMRKATTEDCASIASALGAARDAVTDASTEAIMAHQDHVAAKTALASAKSSLKNATRLMVLAGTAAAFACGGVQVTAFFSAPACVAATVAFAIAIAYQTTCIDSVRDAMRAYYNAVMAEKAAQQALTNARAARDALQQSYDACLASCVPL